MNTPAKPIFEFGPFRLDVAQRLLLCDGEPVPLTPKAFDTLAVLVQQSGRLLEKDDLLKLVWPDSIVEEGNLTNNIFVLRKALGESAEQKYIETIPKRGYRFIAPVRTGWDEGVDLTVAERIQSRTVIEETVSEKEWESGGGGEGEAKSISPAFSPVHPFTRSPIRPFLIIGLLVILAAALTSFWILSRPKEMKTVATVKSIAVLPFKPLRADESEAYLGLGIADTLITKLSTLQQLIVRPTSAVRKYSSPEQDPLAAGREQQVDAVLEGNIQRAGERVRVTVRLLSIEDGRPLWAAQYDEPHFTDIFAVQDSISEEVAQALLLKLTEKEQKQLTKRYTENAEVYQLYLKGRYSWEKWSQDGSKQAVEYFEEAIKRDPNYALAYSGLADAYIFGAGTGLPQKEAHQRAREAAMKALALDPRLGEAHASLAIVLLYDDWDFSGAEREFKRAIELSPSYAEAHHVYSHYLLLMGRIEESLAESKKLLELDPVSETPIGHLGSVYLYTRQYDEAIQQFQKALQLYPDATEHALVGHAYYQKGMFREAVEEYLKDLAQSGFTPDKIAALREAFGKSGIKGYLQKRIEQLKAGPQPEGEAITIAGFYAQLGDKDQAFQWLEKAYAEHSDGLVRLKEELAFDNLRSDPRFTDLLRRIGLAP
jgi:DNA-binding winged helix-turn-helix (wHTH) protein/TolB-like protein/Flp pilus assembly protein TadD